MAQLCGTDDPLWRDLHEAISTRNNADIRLLAHTLKGSCRNLGAESMAEICQSLPRGANQGDIFGADAALKLLKTEFDRARVVFRAIAPNLNIE